MAAQFTEVTLEDMDRFLKRGWRALRPKASVYKGETCYDLFLSENVAVRVLTSISARGGSGAGVGEDAIRVTLFMPKKDRPMLTGKWPIVKRTQGWKNNLQDRIEDMIETYEDREGYFEERAGGKAPEQERLPLQEPERDREREEVQQEIQERQRDPDPPPPPPAPTPRRTDLRATFQKLRSGDWGLRIQGDARPGDEVVATTQAGKSQRLTVGEVVWRGDGVTVTTIARSPRTAGEESTFEPEDNSYSYDRGA